MGMMASLDATERHPRHVTSVLVAARGSGSSWQAATPHPASSDTFHSFSATPLGRRGAAVSAKPRGGGSGCDSLCASTSNISSAPPPIATLSNGNVRLTTGGETIENIAPILIVLRFLVAGRPANHRGITPSRDLAGFPV